MASSIERKYMLFRKYYEFVDRKGVYTRKRGLDRETNKQLLLKHIRDNRDKNKPDMMDNDPLKILSIKEQIKI
jgi:ATP-dependent DNA helicase RecG